ncbi:hypothetical protein DMH04_32180 [Kibdelosporangium aridum]|uniref:Uncharacterized protein n=1 Tax=Kibdelosporangium aridum TaxID=2030 RepID=A0A428Z2A2_KIBAR|nr:hypothetical protein DMH04_32180 [Kibdelosporangium aridum]
MLRGAWAVLVAVVRRRALMARLRGVALAWGAVLGVVFGVGDVADRVRSMFDVSVPCDDSAIWAGVAWSGPGSVTPAQVWVCCLPLSRSVRWWVIRKTWVAAGKRRRAVLGGCPGCAARPGHDR